jgi:ABC-type transport system substrate-binding protein
MAAHLRVRLPPAKYDRMKTTPVLLTSISFVLMAALTGCSSPGGGSPATATSTASSTSSTTSSTSPSVTSTAATGTSVQTVDPNTATADEVTAALRSAGVDNPEKWAHEVKEYAPYTAENLQPKLTEELGKYDISQDQLRRVLGSLKVG